MLRYNYIWFIKNLSLMGIQQTLFTIFCRFITWDTCLCFFEYANLSDGSLFRKDIGFFLDKVVGSLS